MRRERLKDQIEDPRVSVFDSFVRAVVVLISIGAVYYALSGCGYSPGARVAAGDGPTGRAAATAPVVVLTATRDHQFFWNHEGPLPVTAAGARLALSRQAATVPEIVIAADESALLGDALALYREARRQGFTRVRLESKTRPTP